MATIFSLVMMTVMLTFLFEAHSSRDTSEVRYSSGASSIVSDSAIARILVELSKPGNSDLLARNYDPINPNTGENYLGEDGIPNSSDETNASVDDWTGYDPSGWPCYQAQGLSAPNINLSGTMGQGSYQLLAYRYNPSTQMGSVLVEGRYLTSVTHVLITISVLPDLDDFPGVAVFSNYPGSKAGVVGLRGRVILGPKSNVYFPPRNSADNTISGSVEPDDPDRANFLNAIWSSNLDGAAADTVAGKLIACDLRINIPQGITGTNFGVITSSQTLRGVGGNVKTSYRLDGIELSGTDILTIDTTGGPVEIDMGNIGIPGQLFILRDNAKIVNIRTDGQPPRVGDVRFMIRKDLPVQLYNQACIENVFIYSRQDELLLRTTAPGCSSGQNTNFEGVFWGEAVLSSKNNASNRNINYLGQTTSSHDASIIPGATSGIAIPEDVSSLIDLLQYAYYPISYRYGEFKSWQQVNL